MAITTKGRAYVGTSGFAYPDWAPLFYPSGLRAGDLLKSYSGRLPAVELNNTFYQQPKPDKIASWLAATPVDFRFVVKAQRGGSMRAFGDAAVQTVEWLAAAYRLFGERLGSVLYRVPENMHRDDEKLRLLLEAWPKDMPLVVEMQNPEWHVDEVFDLLTRHNATLCATDLDGRDAPDLRLTGRSIYLRLRRTTYGDTDLADWAGRLSAFLESGTDCYVFFRHDEDGTSALRAVDLRDRLSAL
ncbi:MAG TPA: DUF72 domain-containing protein [Candidatus Limnocylindria bacterium]|nr:DUF72 domain-containing protein [Candidatus Limnocylindria bacterium]